ncbi:MAG: hypothetical protein ACR2MA_06230 [Egibacteraceae bacterium]
MGDAAATNVRAHLHHVDNHDLCRVEVGPCGFPVDAKVIHQKPNQPQETRTEFFVRVGNSTTGPRRRGARKVHRSTLAFQLLTYVGFGTGFRLRNLLDMLTTRGA